MTLVYKNKAFSLLELAIVMVVIGLLAIGISNGQRLINKGRLSKARMLTSSAPVGGIEGLTLWLEPTYPDSITKDENGFVSSWHDLSPFGNDVTQVVLSSRPKFVGNVVGNGIPALEFDGTDDYLEKVITMHTGPSTIFIVYKIDGEQAEGKPIFAGINFPDASANNSYQIEYGVDSKLRIRYTDSSGVEDGSKYFEDTANTNTNIVSLTIDGVNTINGYFNGAEAFTDVTTANPFSGKYERYRLGRSRGSNTYLEGYIAEVIIYKAVLSNAEREEVENYLSNKYNITLGS